MKVRELAALGVLGQDVAQVQDSRCSERRIVHGSNQPEVTRDVWEFFDGSEGRVFYRRWDPQDAPVRIVLLVHGYAEHGGRYGHVADALTAGGVVVYAGDHLGHGRSDGERGLITNFDHVDDDLHTLTDIARREYPELPLALVGHSVGGLLSARYAECWPEEVAGVGSAVGHTRMAMGA